MAMQNLGSFDPRRLAATAGAQTDMATPQSGKISTPAGKVGKGMLGNTADATGKPGGAKAPAGFGGVGKSLAARPNANDQTDDGHLAKHAGSKRAPAGFDGGMLGAKV